MGDIVTYTEYVGMTIEDLKPYLETLTASLDRLTEVTFAVGVMLAAWFLYSFRGREQRLLYIFKSEFYKRR